MVRITLPVVLAGLVIAPLVWSDQCSDPFAAIPTDEQTLQGERQVGEAGQDWWAGLLEILRGSAGRVRIQLHGAPPPELLEHLGDLQGRVIIRGNTIIVEPPPSASWSMTCLADGGPRLGATDPCDLGRQLSRMPACRSEEDCAAHRLWTDSFGEPGLREALPRAPGATWTTSRGTPPGER